MGSALLVVLLVAALLMQIEVTDAEVAVTRGCGSVFDNAVDRSGWQLWWARDLDEADEIRSALVRTSRCPDAVNRRVVVAAGLAITAIGLGAVGRRRTAGSGDVAAGSVGHRVTRIGRFTSALGGALTALGVIAVVVLVADGDSTLFLYTDRLVVAIVGLIVLIPTIGLIVIGRVLMLVGENVQRWEQGRPDG